LQGGVNMPKDSQLDKKEVRKKKSNGNKTIATENQQNNRNKKRQSVEKNDV